MGRGPDGARPVTPLELPSPYLLFLGDVTERPYIKTALGLKDWAPDRCLGEYASPGVGVTAGLPWMTPAQAAAAGAKAMVIGAATAGGAVAPAWLNALNEALEAGLDLISGMHTPLADSAGLAATAARLGRRLIDVRTPPPNIPIARGVKRGGKRLLTVGTDCALGKKYTALSLTQAFKARGLDAQFRATGQTGILIAGGGIPMDAVVADFCAGAAEILAPEASPDHWDLIEGQGSLFHPSYAGVSLALLHGAQPDVIVLCHEPGRTRMLGASEFHIPSLPHAISLNLELAARVNPDVRCAGISLNTSHLSEAEAAEVIASTQRELGLPVADPIRGGVAFEQLVDACLVP